MCTQLGFQSRAGGRGEGGKEGEREKERGGGREEREEKGREREEGGRSYHSLMTGSMSV